MLVGILLSVTDSSKTQDVWGKYTCQIIYNSTEDRTEKKTEWQEKTGSECYANKVILASMDNVVPSLYIAWL